jgi:integrase
MGRKRTKHKNLPPRVYVHYGSYRFVPKVGKPIRLAKVGDYSGMLRALADALGGRPSISTLASLMDRYELEVIPAKSESTQKDQCRQLRNLRRAFGHMEPSTLRQHHAIQYRNKRAEKAPTAANREMELLSHVCTLGVEWGAMDFNPLRRMRKLKRPPRDRYVTNEEYLHVWSLASPMVQCVMDLAMLTGLRRGDIFKIERKHLTNEGILIRPGKTEKTTGKCLLFEWSSSLRSVTSTALTIRPQVRQHVVCNRKGKEYTKNGFDSVWQRLMAKATSGENAIRGFQFRDLRRKSATDEIDEKTAQTRLGHSSPAITRRVYRVKPDRVKPLL